MESVRLRPNIKVPSFNHRPQHNRSINRLSIARNLSFSVRSQQCPLLCKEFIVDAWQIYNARAKGADAVLLIAAVLPDLDIGYMIKICKILGMATLVEDSVGIIVELSECIASRGGSILNVDVCVPENKSVFYPRGEFIYNPAKWPREQINKDFHKLAMEFNAMRSVVRVPDIDPKYKIAILASKQVHDEREMDRVLGIQGVELIGINNRSLETFEVDISNTKKLLEGERGEIIRQRDIIVVGESGLFTPDDVAYVQEAGVRAVLVGESLVKQSDPGKGIGLFGKDISS